MAPPPITLRRARASDAPALGAFLQGLSVGSRRFRFHGATSGASPALQRLLCDVDGARHQAWLAWSGEGDAAVVVGEARFVIGPAERGAELAIAVADDWQGRGLAHRLMQQLVCAAATAGVARLYGDVLNGNARMRAFLCRHGFETDRPARGSTVRMSRRLPAARAEAARAMLVLPAAC